MPRLKPKSNKRTFKVTARLTSEEEEQLIAAARKRDMSLSAFAREAVLASLRATPSERLMLAKTCKIEAMLQLLFGGLFAQLNDNKPFEREHFRQALETADAVQFRKADEHVLKHAASTGEVFHG
jgi:hypothetical protein